MIKLVVNTRESSTRPTLITATLFNEIELNLKYDSIASTFRLQLFFDPNNHEHAELAAVSHIHECKLYYVHDKPGMYAVGQGPGGKAILGLTHDELILTGFMLSQLFIKGPKPTFMEIGGYSKPGVIGDCDFPTKAYPLESIGMSLRQIINQKVLPYFSDPASGGFKFYVKSSRADSVFETDINKKQTKANSLGLPESMKAFIQSASDDTDEPIDKTTGPESQNILSYLKDLAVQKNLILSTDCFGNLIVNVPYTGDSKGNCDYIFEIGTNSIRAINPLDIKSSYNGQAMFSDIEVVGQAPKDNDLSGDGGNMPYAHITNPFVPIVYRPKVIKISSGTNDDCLRAAIRERSSQLSHANLKIELDKPAVNGRFIFPNNMIRVISRDNYFYIPSQWFIEEMNYKLNADGEKATITAVPPGVYDTRTPMNPFVLPGENLGRV
jgi:hypothetical protein